MVQELYSTREQWLNAFVAASRLKFEQAGHPLPDKVRVSVGFTSSGNRGKSIGECWSSTCSEDGYFEIFLKPTLQTDSRIADVLTHELCHAAVGLAARHGKLFKACATALGLGGKMTSTVAMADWYTWALPVLAELGPMPYGVLGPGESSAKPKQKTNLLKVECDACGWIARVTLRHIEPHMHLNCPTPDCDGQLRVEG
jgi:SprT-like family